MNMDLTDSLSNARVNLSGKNVCRYLWQNCMSIVNLIWYIICICCGTEELLIKYVLDQHHQDLINILEAQDEELHYSVVVQ